MFCAVRVTSLSAITVTGGEQGGMDEVYFLLTGGSAANMKSGVKINRYGNRDVWEAGPGAPPVTNVVLWQGFIGVNEIASFNVTIREQDNSGTEAVGRFTLSITVNGPTQQPTFLWQADTTYTSIIGPANNETVTISAKELRSNYLLQVTVDQGSTITSVHSDKCLDVAGGLTDDRTNVQEFEPHGGPNQRWAPRLIQPLPRVADSPPFPPPSGNTLERLFWTFAFHVDHSGSCLDVALEANQARNVQQFAPHFRRNQLWFILPAPQAGEFFIVSAHNGHALDVEGESTADGGNVQVFPFNGNANQRWRISPPPLIDSTTIAGDEFVHLVRS